VDETLEVLEICKIGMLEFSSAECRLKGENLVSAVMVVTSKLDNEISTTKGGRENGRL